MPVSDRVAVLLADMEELLIFWSYIAFIRFWPVPFLTSFGMCQYCAVMNIPKCLVMIVECHQFTNTINLLPTIKFGDSITKVVILQQYNLQNDHLNIQSTK